MIKTIKQRSPAQILFGAALLLLFLWLGIKGCRITHAAQSLQARQDEAEALIANGYTNIDLEGMEGLILGLREDVVILKTETAVFLPLAPYLEWLPNWGATIAASPHLLEMADAGTETAVYALQGFKPAIAAIQTNPSSLEFMPTLAQAINEARPELAAMSLSLEKVIAARSQIETPNGLPLQLQTLLKQMDEWLPLVQDGLKLTPYLPQMMGVGTGGPRRYLIIAQNSDELRPTGGFISGGGLLVVENGRILTLDFMDSNQVDNWKAKPYDFPPQPLYDFMRLELFLFRDANFWPDFPTSAEKALELYSYGQDTPPLDGAIAVDQRFLQLLVEATGPISIPDSDLVIDSDNVIENLQAGWAIQEGQNVRDWIFNRKDFIGVFAQAIQTKVESDFSSIDSVILIQNLLQAIEAKDLQIYLRDPAIAAVLNDLHWDGRLPINPPHDFLMVVDSNIGYTKANGLMKQSLVYELTIREDKSTLANVTFNFQHAGQDTGEPCRQDVVYNLETAVSYQTLVNRCYWTYLRIYTPPGSQLVTSSRHTVPGETIIAGETWDNAAQTINDLSGLKTFANYMMIARGQRLSAQFTYQLPSSVIHSEDGQNQYQLLLFKQAGVQSQPISITITLPEKVNLQAITPTPSRIENNTVYFEFNLVKDTVIIVNYR